MRRIFDFGAASFSEAINFAGWQIAGHLELFVKAVVDAPYGSWVHALQLGGQILHDRIYPAHRAYLGVRGPTNSQRNEVEKPPLEWNDKANPAKGRDSEILLDVVHLTARSSHFPGGVVKRR